MASSSSLARVVALLSLLAALSFAAPPPFALAQDLASGITDAANSAIDTAVDTAGDLVNSTLGNSSLLNGTNVTDALGGVADTAKNAVGGAVDSAQDALSNIGRKLLGPGHSDDGGDEEEMPEDGGAMAANVTDFGNTTDGNATTITDALNDKVDTVLNETTTAVEGGLNATNNATGGILEPVTGAVGDAVDTATDAVGGAVDTATDALNSITGRKLLSSRTLLQIGGDIAGDVTSALQNAGENAAQSIAGTATNAVNTLVPAPGLESSSGSEDSALLADEQSDAANLVPEIVNATEGNGSLPMANDTLPANLTDGIMAQEDAAQRRRLMAGHEGHSAMDDISAGLNETFSRMNETFANMTANAPTVLNNTRNQLNETFSNVTTALGDAARRVGDEAREIGGQIRDGVEQLGDDIRNAFGGRKLQQLVLVPSQNIAEPGVDPSVDPPAIVEEVLTGIEPEEEEEPEIIEVVEPANETALNGTDLGNATEALVDEVVEVIEGQLRRM